MYIETKMRFPSDGMSPEEGEAQLRKGEESDQLEEAEYKSRLDELAKLIEAEKANTGF